MKKTCLLLLMALLPLCFISCSSDDEESISKEQLVGKWIETRYQWIDSRAETPEDESFNDDTRYLQINADGTGIVSPYNLFEDEKRDGTFTWTLSGKYITIIGKDYGEPSSYGPLNDVYKGEITKISSTELVLTNKDKNEEQNYEISEIVTFKKAVK